MRKAGFTLSDMTSFAYGKKTIQRKGKRDELERDREKVSAKLWGHRIATLTPNRLSISSAGWKTNTTKARLNKILPSDIGYIKQKKYSWYLVTPKGKSVPFKDNMSFKL